MDRLKIEILVKKLEYVVRELKEELDKE